MNTVDKVKALNLKRFLVDINIHTDKFCCPVKQHSNPRGDECVLSTAAKNKVYCFKCSRTYDIIDIVRAKKNCSFEAAVKILSKKYLSTSGGVDNSWGNVAAEEKKSDRQQVVEIVSKITVMVRDFVANDTAKLRWADTKVFPILDQILDTNDVKRAEVALEKITKIVK